MQGLHGLVVCGGLSTRMGADKSMMIYHKKPQWQHVFELLEGLCQTVSISCNKNQLANFPLGYPTVVDDEAFQEIGPMGALLTAMKNHPTDSFFAVGCDYPMVTSESLKLLVVARNPDAETVCFCHPSDKADEPLLAIYEPAIHPRLRDFFSKSNFSLQQVLQQSTAQRVALRDPSILINANTVSEARHIHLSMNATLNLKS